VSSYHFARGFDIFEREQGVTLRPLLDVLVRDVAQREEAIYKTRVRPNASLLKPALTSASVASATVMLLE